MHYIFSETLDFENSHPKVKVVNYNPTLIKDLKNENGTDIYLCGGGEFAGWLLDHQLIDVLKIKHNPILLGDGTRLFGSSNSDLQLKLNETQNFEDGVFINTYSIEY